MRAAALLLVALLATSAPAQAAGFEKPPELNGKISSAAPLGTASLNKMFLHVYDIALWTDKAGLPQDAPYAIEIRYDMHFTVPELVDRSISEMERSGKMTPEEKEKFRKALTARFAEVHPGDVITALYQPKTGGSFYYNGKRQGGTMPAADMQRFLAIWIGPDTSEPAVRDKLLGRR